MISWSILIDSSVTQCSVRIPTPTVSVHCSPAMLYVRWQPQHLDSDLCHQRPQSDAAHENRRSSFDGCSGAGARAARQLQLPPLRQAPLCGCKRWRCLKTGRGNAGAVTPSASASFIKARNSTLRFAEKIRGDAQNLCSYTCDADGDYFLSSPAHRWYLIMCCLFKNTHICVVFDLL